MRWTSCSEKIAHDFGWRDRGCGAWDLAIQPDGRIVAAGIVSEHGCCQPGLARYMPDGSLDQTFGRGGKVVAEPPEDYFSYAYAVN